MKPTVVIALAVLLLAGCQNTPADTVLIAKARDAAFLPDCRSLRVIYARQIHSEYLAQLVAGFAGTPTCMKNWADRLEASDWMPEHHGGWSSPDDGIFAALRTSTEGVVVWEDSDFVIGVPDLTQEFAR